MQEHSFPCLLIQRVINENVMISSFYVVFVVPVVVNKSFFHFMSSSEKFSRAFFRSLRKRAAGAPSMARWSAVRDRLIEG